MGIVERYVLQLNIQKQRFRRTAAFLAALSLLVVFTVSWNLRQTGITLANDACCGLEEHRHSEECLTESVLECAFAAETGAEETPEDQTEGTEETEVHLHDDACYRTVYLCGKEAHIHQLLCYADLTADLETADVWEASLPELTGRISEDVVLVAQSQIGSAESTLNFEVADDGETQNGITRYGQWYGNPYGAWSNMFTSFCLHYAGLSDIPVNAGAEALRIAWEEAERYRIAGNYEPVSGDIVFLDKNQNGSVDATAVVVGYFDFVLTVIEGDVDNAVVQHEYRADDPMITGYGLTNPAGTLQQVTSTGDDFAQTVGQTVEYNSSLFESEDEFVLYTVGSDGEAYAIDGNGNAVLIKIDSNGTITSNVPDPATLYWTFEKAENYETQPAHYIRNVATGMCLHSNTNANAPRSLRTTDAETVLYTDDNGVRLGNAANNTYTVLSETDLVFTETSEEGSVFNAARAPAAVTLWLDGTNGGIMSYLGSDNTAYSLKSGDTQQLPSEWKSPKKYSYTLAGWVDIMTGDYYLPGEEITVVQNTVLYADWVASTYDIGQYNANVADTISTNDFITTHVFDYSALINLNSAKVTSTISDRSHSESWSHVERDEVTYKKHTTLNFSFNDHDSAGAITQLNNLNDANKYTGGAKVHKGIYNETLGDALFGTDNLFDPQTEEGIVGKHYLGQGDHLFQINTDPSSDYYGYYYYDAKLNAASYNQTDQRFYVYEYLSRTSDSANSNDSGKYSDFLPLNSPYANTNGQTVKTYDYTGDNGEYTNVKHYTYDARYNTNSSADTQVKANLWFGMRVDVRFNLPDTPGDGGNKDIYGNDMHFKFTGDDDVWIVLDAGTEDEMVLLDLGGIHQAVDGDINFSTGVVRVNGSSVDSDIEKIKTGEHTLSILYLERGSSMSNCSIYFNLAPKYSLTLEKEDVLMADLPDGATFAFYEDVSCLPASASKLWSSEEAYYADLMTDTDDSINEFVVKDGKAYIWGLDPSHTYYIKEVTPPTYSDGVNRDPLEKYSPSKGIIKLTLNKMGLDSEGTTILPESVDGEEPEISSGFTIHGFRIDEENQAAYISITNAQNWVQETTSVYVEKVWDDTEDHTYDSVTVYLNAADASGTVHRIREVTLSEQNDWKYAWTNLPKYMMDTTTLQESQKPVQYSVSEAYISGYAPQIRPVTSGETFEKEFWAESDGFENGKTYLIKTDNGSFLSAEATNKDTLCYVDEATAKNSDLALWTVEASGKSVRLTNKAGQSITYTKNGNRRYYRVTTGKNENQTLTVHDQNKGRLYYTDRSRYYIGDLSGGYATAASGNVWTLHPMIKTTESTTVEFDGLGYLITNTPLTKETSLTVHKVWENTNGNTALYEKAEVTVKLLANEVDTGRTETISLKTNWMAEFNGLPYLDDEGNPIKYTVVETWQTKDWIPSYSVVSSTGGENPTYSMTVTNVYRWTGGVELPSTGGSGTLIYVIGGLILILAPLIYTLNLRRRYRKEAKR